MNNSILFEIKNLTKEYYAPFFSKNKKIIRAVNNVSFDINENEIFGLVGESGCGKSTLGKNIIMMDSPTSGDILYKKKSVMSMNKADLAIFKRKMQLIYQDSYASFNPKMTIKQIIEEPLKVCTNLSFLQRNEIIQSLIYKVGLNKEYLSKLPDKLSGGQKQRVGIARAISTNPQFIVCDEPVSALDVSIQGQVLNMLKNLKEEYNLTILFIGHNLPVIYNMATRLAVMFKGEIVEMGETKALFKNIAHPYTKALFSTIPSLQNVALSTKAPVVEKLHDNITENSCVYCSRCPYCFKTCLEEKAQLRKISSGHFVACHYIN